MIFNACKTFDLSTVTGGVSAPDSMTPNWF